MKKIKKEMKEAFNNFLDEHGLKGLKKLIKEVKTNKKDDLFNLLCEETTKYELRRKMNNTKYGLPVWTTKNPRNWTKHCRIRICWCCGKRFEIATSLATGRRFFNKEHEKQWYEKGGRKGKVWSKVKVEDKRKKL